MCTGCNWHGIGRTVAESNERDTEFQGSVRRQEYIDQLRNKYLVMMVTASWRLLAMTVPWLRWSLVGDIPPQRIGFSLLVFLVGYAVDEKARGQFFRPSLRLSDGPILLSYLLSEKGTTDPSEAAGPRDYCPIQDIQ